MVEEVIGDDKNRLRFNEAIKKMRRARPILNIYTFFSQNGYGEFISNEHEVVNARGQSLEGQDLSDLDFYKANFEEANFERCVLSKVNFEETNINKSKISYAKKLRSDQLVKAIYQSLDVSPNDKKTQKKIERAQEKKYLHEFPKLVFEIAVEISSRSPLLRHPIDLKFNKTELTLSGDGVISIRIDLKKFPTVLHKFQSINIQSLPINYDDIRRLADLWVGDNDEQLKRITREINKKISEKEKEKQNVNHSHGCTIS